MVEVRESNRYVEPQKGRLFEINYKLKILGFLKERESRGLETYGATIKKGLDMHETVYTLIGSLEKEGKIERYEKKNKKYVKLTNLGEDAVKKCFCEMFPSYETDLILERFVKFLSAKTNQYLKERHSGLNYIPDRYLRLLSEDLRELYENKLKEFCREIKRLKREVISNEN